jgi:hypothetical protein
MVTEDQTSIVKEAEANIPEPSTDNGEKVKLIHLISFLKF